jgi:NADP-dependent alcohol dehydrogenase
MYNFEYRNTVKIIFGKGTIPMVANELPKRAKILMTYGGGSIKNNGVYDQVKGALKGFKLYEFGGIEPNPHYETCMEAVKLIKENKINFLLSVGGGSVLDATKFIAAAACYKGEDPWDIISKGTKVEEALPLADVLTLPATGSEMNGNSVISRVSTQEKKSFASPLVLPKFSILDPETIFSLPNLQVANGVVDAFVHVMEQYLTFPVNSPLQDRFAESILLTLVEEGPKVLANRKDYNSAANYMWCATMALNGLIGVGVAQDWATHMIGHELTAFHGIDHAQTLAIVLPGVMNIRRNEKKEKILQYAERIWKIEYGTEDEKIDQAIAQTISFFERMGIATRLSDYGVPVETISKITSRFNKRGVSFGEKGDIGPGEVKLILQNRL